MTKRETTTVEILHALMSARCAFEVLYELLRVSESTEVVHFRKHGFVHDWILPKMDTQLWKALDCQTYRMISRRAECYKLPMRPNRD